MGSGLSVALYIDFNMAAAALVGNQVPDFDIHPVGAGDSTTMRALLAQGKPILLDIYAEW
jgi:hypothetical protein